MMNRKLTIVALCLGIMFLAGYVFMWPPTTGNVSAEQSVGDNWPKENDDTTAKLISSLIDAKVEGVKLEIQKEIADNCVSKTDEAWTDLKDAVEECIYKDDDDWKDLMSWKEDVDSKLTDHDKQLANHKGRITKLESCVECGGGKDVTKKKPKGVKTPDGKSSSGGDAALGRGKKAKGVQPLPLVTAEKVQMNADICGNPEVTPLPSFTVVLGPDDPARQATIDYLQAQHPLFKLRNAVVVNTITGVEVP